MLILKRFLKLQTSFMLQYLLQDVEKIQLLIFYCNTQHLPSSNLLTDITVINIFCTTFTYYLKYI